MISYKLTDFLRKNDESISPVKKMGRYLSSDIKVNSRNVSQVRVKEINRHIPQEIFSSMMWKVEKITPSIEKNEMNTIQSIIESNYCFYNKKNKLSLSEIISDEVKKKLGGEWFVIAQKSEQKLNFNISSVSDSDIVKFKIGNSIFGIARISI